MFKIQTLSNRMGGLNDMWASIVTALSAMLPAVLSLFNGGAKQLTSADWWRLFPVNGNWYNKLRDWMSLHIKWSTDIGNVQPFTIYFCYDSGLVDLSNTDINQRNIDAMQKLNSYLQAEAQAQGVTVTPNPNLTWPGATQTTPSPVTNQASLLSNPLFLILGAGLLFSVMNKKDKR